MSRMITRNGGVRPADGLSGVTQDKVKESSLVADVSAASSVKRTTDLFTEADKEALQPGGTAQGIKDAARDLLATATSGAVLPQKEGSDALKPATGAGENGHQQDKGEGVNAVATADEDDEDDDGYLSDDPEERYEAAAKGEVAQRVRFAITLLVPVEFKPEVTRVQATLRALFGIWKDLGVDVQTTTKFQELGTQYLNKKQYCRLQVSFDRARDANFVWRHGIVHICMDGKTRINLDWQHPVDPAYVKARAADPALVEVLFKGVDAVITPDMLREMLVVVKLVVRGRPAFKEGCCFHRVVNPVTGMDTDKVKGLVRPHAGDKYRWRHLVEDPVNSDKQLLLMKWVCRIRAAASVRLTDLTRLILKDPALVLISTGGNREEWICVQECCDKACGVTFAQAAEHVVSQRHSDGTVSGAATRSSKAGVALPAARKEFGV
ncbi:unnamed protein product [Closterium sp. Naga37s-1]|nr:unnamed protein product [Closterium sp. Naga37s-1]